MRSHRLPVRPLAATAVAALLVSGCSFLAPPRPEPSPVGTASAVADDPALDPALAVFYDQDLAWVDCSGGFECSRLVVPVDYDDPTGETIALSVLRSSSAVGEDRLGSLVVNPGGPGASGVEYARGFANGATDAVRDHFDVVGFDPRGVGGSAPLQCLDDEQLDAFMAVDPTPDDEDEVQDLVDEAVALGQGCAAAGDLAAHVGTASVAQDMDVLRAALGDDKLNYLGKSYGTYMGAFYAERFPQRVGRFVLDGAIDPALSAVEVNAGQAEGFETALRSYVEDCLEGDGCPLSGSVDDGVQQVRDWLDSLEAEPLPTGTDRPLVQALGYLGIIQPLYSTSFWPQLTDALTAAFRGDGAQMLVFADAYAARQPDGSYANNSATVISAVSCLDRGDQRTLAEVEESVVEFETDYPTLGGVLAWGGVTCPNWPFRADSTPHPIAAEGAGPVLVVGTTRDPATPYAWAESLASQLSSGRLLTYDGDGHTAYRTGDRCVDETVDAYLVAGELPEEGTEC